MTPKTSEKHLFPEFWGKYLTSRILKSGRTSRIGFNPPTCEEAEEEWSQTESSFSHKLKLKWFVPHTDVLCCVAVLDVPPAGRRSQHSESDELWSQTCLSVVNSATVNVLTLPFSHLKLCSAADVSSVHLIQSWCWCWKMLPLFDRWNIKCVNSSWSSSPDFLCSLIYFYVGNKSAAGE